MEWVIILQQIRGFVGVCRSGVVCSSSSMEGEERKSINIATFILRVVSKCSDISYTVLPANYTMPYFLCKRSPDGVTRNWDDRHLIAAYDLFIDPEGMKGWVDLAGWPIARRFTHINQLHVERWTGKVRRPKTVVMGRALQSNSCSAIGSILSSYLKLWLPTAQRWSHCLQGLGSYITARIWVTSQQWWRNQATGKAWYSICVKRCYYHVSVCLYCAM